MQHPGRLWLALEHIPGLSAVRAEWRQWLGDELAWAEAHVLRPTGELATVYPSVHGEPYHIIDHGGGRFRGVHSDGAPSLDLSTSDVTILRIDVVRLAQHLCDAFGFRPDSFVDSGVSGCYRIGTARVTAKTCCPVTLVVRHDDSMLHDSITQVIAQAAGPFVIMTPGTIVDRALTRVLGNRHGCHLPLSEALQGTASGLGEISPAGTAILEAFRRLVRTLDSATNIEEPYLFQRRGEVWTLRFNGGSVLQLPHSKSSGLAYIHEAIQKPGIALDVVHLDSVIALAAAVPRPGSAGEVLGKADIARYRGLYESTEAELDEAKRFSDVGKIEQLQARLDAFTRNIHEATGLKNHLRIAADDVERLRKKVGMAIWRARTAVRAKDAAFGRHLQANVRSGREIVYVAEPSPDWLT